VLAYVSGCRWFIMLLALICGVTLCIAFIALSTVLLCQHQLYFWYHFVTSTPGNCWLRAHISTYYFIIFNHIHQQGILPTFATLLMRHDISYGRLLLFTG
jgi:hypothetical protein